MEKRGNFNVASLDEVLDKYIGKEDIPERIQFEKEVDEALDNYYRGLSIQKASEQKNKPKE